MRSKLVSLSAGVVLAGLVLAGCGKQSAADRACHAREDMRVAIERVAEDVRQGNFGVARDDLAEVKRSYNALRDAVTDLTAQERDALRPRVDALASDVAAIGEAQDLAQVGALLESALGDAQALLTDVSTTLSCD